jgi:hypothetical protein
MQDNLVITVMHERDHLAYGFVNAKQEHVSTADEHVAQECSAWALTCEYTLRPMIEDYQRPMTDDISIMYKAWLEAGRNEESPLWKQWIRSNPENSGVQRK